jgi:hypothetical protein
MNLQHLNLDLFGIPEDAEIQLPVFLIASDLKTRKLVNAFTGIGCDGSFCVPDLCDLVLAFVRFNDRPNELYDFYFELLDRDCDKVSHENDMPIKEAYRIYNELVIERRKKEMA